MTQLWRGMDRATLDREYNARATVPDFPAEMARYAQAATQARATLPHTPDLVFDPAHGNGLDWFPGAPGGPVMLYIHGGYWRALSKADHSGVAPGPVSAGIHVAIMDYSLAPAATLDLITDQVRQAVRFVHATAPRFGADPARLFVAGSSAGGHLCGMVISEPFPIRGAIALSGLYELEPVRLSHINDWMNLSEADVARLSPQRHIPRGPAPRLLASYGGRETAEFQRQTEDYAAAWQHAGHAATVLPQAARHHFDIVLGLGDAADPLGHAAIGFMLQPD